MSDTTKANNKLLKFGIIGTVVAALGCFTPLFVVGVGLVGLSAVTGYLDYVLFPALGIFSVLTIYALWCKYRRPRTVRNEQL